MAAEAYISPSSLFSSPLSLSLSPLFSLSLVSLLGYAEELHCKFAYIFFERSTSESCQKQILRNFRFLGFELLSPIHPKLPVRSDDYVFLGYEIDPGGDSDSDVEDWWLIHNMNGVESFKCHAYLGIFNITAVLL